MNQPLFELFLDSLEPKTLACIVRDLENTVADWGNYPETAPDDRLKNELEQLIERIKRQGIELTDDSEPGFLQLVEQARAELRQDEDWALQRDRQERRNWLQDYE
jgi:hypothetical protein